VLQCVAVCYNVLQCITVCCNVLQFVAVCCSVLRLTDLTKTSLIVASQINTLKNRIINSRWRQKRLSCSCTVLRCVAVCCSVLQHVAMCCSVLQCVAPDLRQTSLIVAQTTKEAVFLVLACQKFSILSSPFISLVSSAASGLFTYYFLVACKRLPCSCSPRVKFSQKLALPLFSLDNSAASRLVRIFDLPYRGAISSNPRRKFSKDRYLLNLLEK